MRVSLITFAYIEANDSLLKAAEKMAQENLDVIPVVSKEKTNIIGVLTSKDIIATFKHGIEEHVKKEPHISLKKIFGNKN